MKIVKLASLLCLYFALACGAFADPAATLRGVARVQDGDGLLFGRVEVRLQGIAAPEDSQKKQEEGGQESTRHLEDMVSGKEVVCELDGTLARKRPVGICYLDGKDIGEMQVKAGHARDCKRYSGGRYAAVERAARRDVRDLRKIYRLPGYCQG